MTPLKVDEGNGYVSIPCALVLFTVKYTPSMPNFNAYAGVIVTTTVGVGCFSKGRLFGVPVLGLDMRPESLVWKDGKICGATGLMCYQDA